MHFQHEPRVQKLRENVLKYNRAVRDLGLRDHQVGVLSCPGIMALNVCLGPKS